MKISIRYSEASERFLSRNQAIITEEEVDLLIVKAVNILYGKEKLNLDLKRLKGSYKNYFRIRKGKIRIIFRIEREEIILVSVNNIDFRGSIY